MAMMLVLTNIGTVILQGSINSFGTATITGHTAARKFHDLCILPLGTICTSSATFVSQNYGARKKERIKQGVSASIVELIGKFAGAFLLSRMIGYLGICLTEPITWIVCVPIVLAGFLQKIKQISKI